MTTPVGLTADTGNRRVLPLLAVEMVTFLSGVGNGVAMVALPWLVLERTGNAAAAGLVAAIASLPMLLSSLFAGTIIDMVGRRRISIASDLLSLLSVAAIPLLDSTIGLSLGVIAALAVVGAVFDPAGLAARESMLPEAARAARWPLERINGVHEAVWGTAFLIGPGLGGVFIALVGAAATFWVTAAMFALCALVMLLVRVPGSGRPSAHEKPEGIWSGTREGLAFLWRERVLRTIAIASMVVVGFWLPVEGVLLPAYFEEQDQPGRLGLVLVALSAGGIAGALIYGATAARLPRRWTFIIALFGSGIGVLGMAFLPPFPWLLVFAAVAGFFYGPINPIINLAMQLRTPSRLRGRVIGLITAVTFAAGPLGYLVAGPLIEAIGVRAAFLWVAGGFLVFALGLPALRSLRGLDKPAVNMDIEPPRRPVLEEIAPPRPPS